MNQHTEEDTFKALSKPSFEQMTRILRESGEVAAFFLSSNDTELLKKNHWTINEWYDKQATDLFNRINF